MTRLTRWATAVAVTGVLVFLLLLAHTTTPSAVTQLGSDSHASNRRVVQYKRVATNYTSTGSHLHPRDDNNHLSTGSHLHPRDDNNHLSTGSHLHPRDDNNHLSTGSHLHPRDDNNHLSTGSHLHPRDDNNHLSTGSHLHPRDDNNHLSTGSHLHPRDDNNHLSTGSHLHPRDDNNHLSTGSHLHPRDDNNYLSTGSHLHPRDDNNHLSTGSHLHPQDDNNYLSTESHLHVHIRDPLANNSEQNPFLPFKAVADVEKFVFFIGYRRSGHSIIGSMLDAHPDIIIAHEFQLFKKFVKFPKLSQSLNQRYQLYSMLYRDSHMEATHGARTTGQDAKGYNLELKNSWQGRFRRLRVIGEKGGSNTVKMYRTAPKLFQRYYQQLLQTTRVPVQVFHVIRNPYDIIATDVLYAANDLLGHNYPRTKLPASATRKYDNETLLMVRTVSLFENARAIVEMVRKFRMNVLELHHEDLIADPKGTIRQICKFLEVECSEDYLQQCSDKTFKSASRSRDSIIWPQKVINIVEKEKQKYPFFQHYTFHED